MILNKYLKDLGLKWEDLPGNYISKFSIAARLKRKWYKIKRRIYFIFEKYDEAPDYDNYFEANAFDIRNKEDKKTGFSKWEFFSLDYSLALYIYPRLCYFKENYSMLGTPCHYCYDENNNHIDNANKLWQADLDKMILAFKYIIKEPEWDTIEEHDKIQEQIEEGLYLFAQNFRNLWY